MNNNVSVGPTTIAGSSVTIAAFFLAVIAFANGARDEETFSALVVGGVALFTTLAGRFAQAIAQALRARSVESPPPLVPPVPRRKAKGV